VSVLCAHPRSFYFGLPVTVFDERRDARTFSGRGPVIAHPPCRGFSRMRGLARASQSELELARWCCRVVQVNGGVLEQPRLSRLWREMALPYPGFSGAGGFCIEVDQWAWGHRAVKPTWLFVARLNNLVPELKRPWGLLNDLVPGLNARAAKVNGRRVKLTELGVVMNEPGGKVNDLWRYERELTPLPFCWWLEELASRCGG
jgi:hypothetical protein